MCFLLLSFCTMSIVTVTSISLVHENTQKSLSGSVGFTFPAMLCLIIVHAYTYPRGKALHQEERETLSLLQC